MAKSTLLKELVDDVPEREPYDAVTLARLAPDGRRQYPDLHPELMHRLPGLKPYRLSEGAILAALRILRIPEHGQRILSALATPEGLPDRFWIEFEAEPDAEGFDQAGYLVEKTDGGLRAFKFYGGPRMVGVDGWPATLRYSRTEGWSIDAEGTVDFLVRQDAVQSFSVLRAALVLIAAAGVVETVPDARRERGVPPFALVRLMDPWREVDDVGVPMALKRPAVQGAAVDFLADDLFASLGMIRIGRQWHETPQHLAQALAINKMMTSIIDEAVRFRLSEAVVSSAVALAQNVGGDLGRLRDLAALTFPLAMYECDAGDLDLGIPNAQIVIMAEAMDEDPRGSIQGFIHAIPAGAVVDGQLANLPRAAYRLHIQGDGAAFELINCTHFDPALVERNLPGFLLALFSLLCQPKFITHRDRPANQAAGKARAKARLAPLRAVREVVLNVDVSVGDGEGGGGGAGRGPGVALHQVRAFWRVRLGKLEFVRPFWRGTAALGVARKRYVVVRDEDVLEARVGGLNAAA